MAKAIQRLQSLCLIGLLLPGCSPWAKVASYQSWTLYSLPGPTVDRSAYRAAFAPAVDLVERRLGPFSSPVRVHAWPRTGTPRVAGLPGGGAALVPAWHQRGGDWTQPEGIYVTVPDTGDAVHELVHAWVAARGIELPLWFEEGLAIYLADGVLTADGWVVDGLATWPWQQLRRADCSPAEIERLLQVGPGAEPWDDLFLHFVGWAAVFDLALEEEANPTGASAGASWERWWSRARAEGPAALRTRVLRTLRSSTPSEWWRRQRDRSPKARRAAALGLSRLGSASLASDLLESSAVETDTETRRTLLLCAAASGGETLLPAKLRQQLGRALQSEAQASDLSSTQRQALRILSDGFLGRPLGRSRANQAWGQLRPYWDG